MKKKVWNILNKIEKYGYNKIHKIQALKALKNIENDTNYKLSSKNKKMINEYAIDKFGSTEYAYWLYVYTAYNQKFKEGWIPDNFYGSVINSKINGSIRNISDVKTLTKKLTNTSLLPDKIYKVNNTFYDIDFKAIDSQDLKKNIFSNKDKDKEYFVKKDNSNQGRGVFKLNYKNYNLDTLKELDNFVIQDAIKQHEFFNEIVSGSVATIRITTVKVKDKFETRAAYLRVGRMESDFLEAVTNIRVPIINSKGELGEFASDVDWKRLYKHPDTGYVFKNKIIPYFTNATKAMEKIHKNFPHFTIIGWDVSITQSGEPQIIEWNAAHNDIKFTEATIGPSFKDLNWEDLKNDDS